MRDSQRSLLVGLTVLASVAGVTYAITTLRGNLSAASTTDVKVDFSDAKGLVVGSAVRLAGIHIGSVNSIELVANKARLTLRVENKYPLVADTQFEIVTPLIGSPPYVQFTMGTATAPISENSVMTGRDTRGMEGIVNTADSVLTKVDNVMSDKQMQEDIRVTVHNLRLASEQLPGALKQAERIMENAAELSASTASLVPKIELQLTQLTKQTNGLLSDVRGAAQSGKKVADEAVGLTQELKGTVSDNRAAIRDSVAATNETVRSISKLVDDLRLTLTDPTMTAGIKGSVANMEAITANTVKITQKLDETVAGLEKLVNDPVLGNDIRTTIANVKDTSASVKDITKRAESIRLPGERRGGSAKPGMNIPEIAEPGLTFDARYGTKSGRLRQDVHAVVPGFAPDSYLRLGLFDATEGNRVDIQQGIIRSDSSVLRYGLFAGKLGVGLDQSLRGYDFRLDVWNPVAITADARLRKRLNAGTALFAGYDGIGRAGGPVIGIQWKR